MSNRALKATVVFAIACLVCIGLGSIGPSKSEAAPCRQNPCPGCPSAGGIPCCYESAGPPARCINYCSGSEPGIPTVPGATAGPPPPTLPPLTQQAKATSESIWATSWVATVGAQETAIVEATQTMVGSVEEIECYSCYETTACASGWAEVCFVRPLGTMRGIMYPYSNDCQAASECEPSSGPKDPECVPGTASGAGTALDPCAGWEWTWDLRVMADVPPHIVQVWPFPRWLVGMGAPLPAPYESGSPGTLTLRQDYPALSNASSGTCEPLEHADSEGCWSAKNNKPDPVRDDPLPGDIKDFRIGLRWRRIDIMPGAEDPTGLHPAQENPPGLAGVERVFAQGEGARAGGSPGVHKGHLKNVEALGRCRRAVGQMSATTQDVPRRTRRDFETRKRAKRAARAARAAATPFALRSGSHTERGCS